MGNEQSAESPPSEQAPAPRTVGRRNSHRTTGDGRTVTGGHEAVVRTARRNSLAIATEEFQREIQQRNEGASSRVHGGGKGGSRGGSVEEKHLNKNHRQRDSLDGDEEDGGGGGDRTPAEWAESFRFGEATTPSDWTPRSNKDLLEDTARSAAGRQHHRRRSSSAAAEAPPMLQFSNDNKSKVTRSPTSDGLVDVGGPGGTQQRKSSMHRVGRPKDEPAFDFKTPSPPRKDATSSLPGTAVGEEEFTIATDDDSPSPARLQVKPQQPSSNDRRGTTQDDLPMDKSPNSEGFLPFLSDPKHKQQQQSSSPGVNNNNSTMRRSRDQLKSNSFETSDSSPATPQRVSILPDIHHDHNERRANEKRSTDSGAEGTSEEVNPLALRRRRSSIGEALRLLPEHSGGSFSNAGSSSASPQVQHINAKASHDSESGDAEAAESLQHPSCLASQLQRKGSYVGRDNNPLGPGALGGSHSAASRKSSFSEGGPGFVGLEDMVDLTKKRDPVPDGLSIHNPYLQIREEGPLSYANEKTKCEDATAFMNEAADNIKRLGKAIDVKLKMNASPVAQQQVDALEAEWETEKRRVEAQILKIGRGLMIKGQIATTNFLDFVEYVLSMSDEPHWANLSLLHAILSRLAFSMRLVDVMFSRGWITSAAKHDKPRYLAALLRVPGVCERIRSIQNGRLIADLLDLALRSKHAQIQLSSVILSFAEQLDLAGRREQLEGQWQHIFEQVGSRGKSLKKNKRRQSIKELEEEHQRLQEELSVLKDMGGNVIAATAELKRREVAQDQFVSQDLTGRCGLLMKMVSSPQLMHIRVGKDGRDGLTVLSRACRDDDQEIVNLFVWLQLGDVNKVCKDGTTPLINAIIAERVEVVKILLTHPNIDMEMVVSGRSALEIAAKQSRKNPLIYTLLQQLAAKRDEEHLGRTPGREASIPGAIAADGAEGGDEASPKPARRQRRKSQTSSGAGVMEPAPPTEEVGDGSEAQPRRKSITSNAPTTATAEPGAQFRRKSLTGQISATGSTANLHDGPRPPPRELQVQALHGAAQLIDDNSPQQTQRNQQGGGGTGNIRLRRQSSVASIVPAIMFHHELVERGKKLLETWQKPIELKARWELQQQQQSVVVSEGESSMLAHSGSNNTAVPPSPSAAVGQQKPSPTHERVTEKMIERAEADVPKEKKIFAQGLLNGDERLSIKPDVLAVLLQLFGRLMEEGDEVKGNSEIFKGLCLRLDIVALLTEVQRQLLKTATTTSWIEQRIIALAKAGHVSYLSSLLEVHPPIDEETTLSLINVCMTHESKRLPLVTCLLTHGRQLLMPHQAVAKPLWAAFVAIIALGKHAKEHETVDKRLALLKCIIRIPEIDIDLLRESEDDGHNLLTRCCFEEDSHTVQFLVDEGLIPEKAINHPLADGSTPLIQAVCGNRVGVVEYLAKHKAIHIAHPMIAPSLVRKYKEALKQCKTDEERKSLKKPVGMTAYEIAVKLHRDRRIIGVLRQGMERWKRELEKKGQPPPP